MELRSRGHVVIAAIAVVVLVVAVPATGHVFPMPTYVATGSSSRVELSVPNERRVQMTGFELGVPTGVAVAEAVPTDGWTSTATERRATWSDGDLSPFATATFALELDIGAAPGTIVLDAVERFGDGEQVRWPVSLVVTPADEPSQRLGVALIVGLAGLLAFTIGAAYLWRRTRGSLQER